MINELSMLKGRKLLLYISLLKNIFDIILLFLHNWLLISEKLLKQLTINKQNLDKNLVKTISNKTYNLIKRIPKQI